MFSFFRKNKDLEALILELENDAANNYKDNAQDDFKRLSALFEELKAGGKLSEKQAAHYGKRLEDFRAMLKDYTHAEQGRKDIGTW